MSESLETGGEGFERIDSEFVSSWVLSVHAIRCETRALARLRIYRKLYSGRQTKFMSTYISRERSERVKTDAIMPHNSAGRMDSVSVHMRQRARVCLNAKCIAQD